MIASPSVKHCGQPAAYVVRDIEGLEWFVCEAHGAQHQPGARWIVRTIFADWFRARALELPPEGSHRCNEGLPEVAN